MWNPFFPWKLLNKVNTSAWVNDNSRQLHRASFRDMSQHSRPFGDLDKVRGPGHLRCANGARQGQLGWGEGAKARDGRARNRHRQRGLVGAKGLKPGRQGQVRGLGWREASGQLGCGPSQNWCADSRLGAKG